MKLYIPSAAILFLMVGITLADNSLKVTGQSALDETQDILGKTANTTANATGELMSRALSLASDTASNATQTAMNKTMNLLSNLSNNVTNGGLNTSSKLTEPINATDGGLKKYENATLGISFQYPSNWREQISELVFNRLHPLDFFVTVPKLDGYVNASLNAIGCTGNEPMKMFDLVSLELEKCDSFRMYVVPFGLDDPNISEPCHCSTLKDFVRWEYNRAGMDKHTFINDNQTTIGNNYSAWQMESASSSSKEKEFTVWAINGNLGYRFLYTGPADGRFDLYLDGFKNMLKSVTFSPPTPEKKPSFLNSSDLQNSSILSSAPTKVQDKPIKIASSNDFIDSLGFLHVVGEVENNSPSNIQFVKVSGTFYDSNNQVVGTGLTYTNPSDIGSGQKAPFELLLTSASIPISQIDHYNLVASYD